MHEHWETQAHGDREGMSNERIDRIPTGSALDPRRPAAGSSSAPARGGFLMFYAEDASELREMARQGLRETRFAFDLDGSTVIVRD